MDAQAEKFSSLFKNGTFYKPAIDFRVISCSSSISHIHSAIWKFYLFIAPNLRCRYLASFEDWLPILEAKREEFLRIKSEFLPPLPPDSADPLSSDE
jgi:hypothetical protein